MIFPGANKTIEKHGFSFVFWFGTQAAKVPGVRRHLLTTIIFAVALSRVQAASSALAEFPFQFREGLLWVDVTIPQSDKPLNFLLDTGAGVSVVNLNTAKRIGLKLGQEVTVRGVDTMLTGYWQRRISAKAGEVRLPAEYIAVDLEKLSRSCERPVDGLIGMDFFRGRVVQIDFDIQKIRLLESAKSELTDDALQLRLEMGQCGIRTPIKVNDHQRQWVRVDTGCATALQWVASDVPPEQCTGTRKAIGLATLSIPQTTTTIVMGGHEFTNVPTGLHETAIFPGEAGLLGNGLLSRYSVVTIDAKAGRMILTERHPVR